VRARSNSSKWVALYPRCFFSGSFVNVHDLDHPCQLQTKRETFSRGVLCGQWKGRGSTAINKDSQTVYGGRVHPRSLLEPGQRGFKPKDGEYHQISCQFWGTELHHLLTIHSRPLVWRQLRNGLKSLPAKRFRQILHFSISHADIFHNTYMVYKHIRARPCTHQDFARERGLTANIQGHRSNQQDKFGLRRVETRQIRREGGVQKSHICLSQRSISDSAQQHFNFLRPAEFSLGRGVGLWQVDHRTAIVAFLRPAGWTNTNRWARPAGIRPLLDQKQDRICGARTSPLRDHNQVKPALCQSPCN
jgi:hypothetical protein